MKGNMFKFFGLMAVVALISSLSLVASADSPSAKIAVVDRESLFLVLQRHKVHLDPLRKVLTLLLLKPNMKALQPIFKPWLKRLKPSALLGRKKS